MSASAALPSVGTTSCGSAKDAGSTPTI
jgi:hypothetical protein